MRNYAQTTCGDHPNINQKRYRALPSSSATSLACISFGEKEPPHSSWRLVSSISCRLEYPSYGSSFRWSCNPASGLFSRGYCWISAAACDRARRLFRQISHTARQRSATATTAPTTMPTHVPVVRLLFDDGCIDAVSAGGLSSVCVSEAGSGVPVGVCSVVRIICVAE
jgi:hypothetical protein